MIDYQNLSQAELANVLGIDRTTVRSWTKLGMPYTTPPARGSKAGFDFSICAHWRAGHLYAERKGTRFDPVQKVAIGWAFGSGVYEREIRKDDEAAYLTMMKRVGLERVEALRLLEFGRGVLA